jgi:hypothetical protein
MDISQHLPADHDTDADSKRVGAHLLLACFVAVAITGAGAHVHVEAISADDDRGVEVPAPDLAADYDGGVAARLYDANSTPLVGDLFLLIGSGNSTPAARVYDSTPYTHQSARHPDTVASNRLAAQTVERITGADIELIEMTNAAAGGSSGGLTRAIAYLNVLSDGAFTGGLRVAATGVLSPEGHVSSIDGIDAKAAAAHLADADVLFTPSVPTQRALDAYSTRLIGEFVRDRSTGSSLNDPRRVQLFREWGASRPNGMDVVDARHLIDVSAYLCGAGSGFACDITERLDRLAQQHLDERTAEASNEVERLRPISGHSG